MKTNDLKQLHTKSADELKKMADDMIQKLFDARMDKVTRSEKNVRLYKNMRHSLAQIKTILKEKQLIAN